MKMEILILAVTVICVQYLHQCLEQIINRLITVTFDHHVIQCQIHKSHKCRATLGRKRIQKFKSPCKVNPTSAVTTQIRRQKQEKGRRDVQGLERGGGER